MPKDITHCNAPFARVSGFTMEELMGQPHNVIHHFNAAEACEDMWSTMAAGAAGRVL